MSEFIDKAFEEPMTAAEKIRQSKKTVEAEIVDVVVPETGNLYKFRKPSTFGMLFHYGRIPQSAAAGAVDAWVEQGVIKPGEISDAQVSQIDNAIRLRDRVLELSVDPKLVVGDALNTNELSTDDMPDADIAYLFKWCAAGGDASQVLGNFSSGPFAGTNAGANRTQRRATAKQSRGNN